MPLILSYGLWAAGCGLVFAAEDSSRGLTGTLLYSRLTEGTWQIWQADLASGERLQVTSSAGDKRYPAWGPDGIVTYCTSNQACFVAQPGRPQQEMFLRDLAPLRDLAWSADGAQVAFARFRTDLVDSANLWIADAQGSRRRLMTQDAGIHYNPTWSPDGTQLAYVGGHGYGTYELYRINADGSGRQQLTRNASHEFLPAWSPDGAWIAFTSDASGDYDIWVMKADGTALRQLTASPGLDTRPAWSPDGRHLAFATNRSGTLAIWVMRSDGSDPRPLERAADGVCDPVWK